MSPRALALRGIPAGVEPKAEEMVRLRDVIYKLMEQGYKVVPAEDGPWTSFAHWPKDGDPVVAVMYTFCGCMRERLVTWPPAARIRVPIFAVSGKFYGEDEPIERMPIRARDFKFDRVEEQRVDGGGPYGLAGIRMRLVYREDV